MTKTNDFKYKVLIFVKKVPKGRVVSYGQVAAAVGSPRAARQVGMILRHANVEKEKIPWWRVVNSQGIISIKGHFLATKEMQKGLLEKDGVVVNKNFQLNIKKYSWHS